MFLFSMETGFERAFRFISRPLIGGIWLALAALSYFFWDQPIAWFMEAHVHSLMAHTAEVVTQLGSGKLYLVAFVLLFLLNHFIYKHKKEAQHWLYLAIVVISSGIVCDALKFILGRARPINLFDNLQYGFYFFKMNYGMVSFPSGHATTAAAVALACSVLWPRYWKLFVVAAVLVGLSRLVLNVHYLSDVIVGWYVGALVAIYVSRFFKKRFSL